MKALITTFHFFILSQLYSQVCTIDYSQTQVGIYPDSLPNAQVGQYYDQDLTFKMPIDTLGYPFLNFQIISLSLPPGLDWICSNNFNNCNYNPQLSPYGCIQISGTPLVAGSFTIDVLVYADLSVVNDYPIQFQIPLDILPFQINNSGLHFSYSQNSACAPAILNFTNYHLGLVHYIWDFGNGNFSNEEQPSAQYYETPGNFVLSYTAYDNLDSLEFHSLTEVSIMSMGNFGGGFPSFELADAYFKIYENGTLFYQSSVLMDQNPPVQWSTQLNLSPLNDYMIEIWEADQSIGEAIFGPDDFIGSQTLNFSNCYSCSLGNAIINYNVVNTIVAPTPTYYSTDTIFIFPPPAAVIVYLDTLTQELIAATQSQTYQWYFNNLVINGATEPLLQIDATGYYYLNVTDSNLCSSSSEIIFIQSTLDEPSIIKGLTQINPNPTNGDFDLITDSFWLDAKMILTTMDGRIILNGTISELKTSFHLNSLDAGVFFLRLEKGTQLQTLRIIKIS